jgi:hypothetical protein
LYQGRHDDRRDIGVSGSGGFVVEGLKMRILFILYFALVLTGSIAHLTTVPKPEHENFLIDKEMKVPLLSPDWMITFSSGMTECIHIPYEHLDLYCTDNPFDGKLGFWKAAMLMHRPKRTSI